MSFVKPKGGPEADFSVPLSFDARQRVSVWNEVRGAEEIDEEKAAEIAACAEETDVMCCFNGWIIAAVRNEILLT